MKKGKRIIKQSAFSNEYFSIKPSNISGAGLGCFTKKYIEKGTTIGQYLGKIINEESFDRKKDTDYIWQINYPDKTRKFIDAKYKKLGNPLRFVNSVTEEGDPNQNVEVFQKHKNIYYKTIRGILPGSEILTDYGDSYFGISDSDEEEDDSDRFEVIKEPKKFKKWKNKGKGKGKRRSRKR
tara:strand:- start:235 stop:777 length:543 start_codon:yes stop_codon:yes gene_type:complete